jgi:type II secretory pathway component PulL
MAREILIIDIGADSVRGGIFSPKKTEPLYIHTHPVSKRNFISEREEIKSAISSLLSAAKEKGFREFEKVLLAIPPHEVSIRILSIPFKDRKKIQDVLPFELSGTLPHDVQEMIVDAIPLGNERVLAAALGKTIVKKYLDMLKEFGLDPYWLGSTMFSMGRLLNGANGGTTAFIGNESFVAASDGEPRFFKPIREINELKLGLLYLESEGIHIDKVYSVDENIKDVKSILPEMDLKNISLPWNYPPEGAGLYALSLHLQKNMEGAINFRKGEYEYTKESEAIKKSLKYTGMLVLIITALILGNIYLKYKGLERDFIAERDALRGAYLELFPEDGRVADELYQFEAKANKLKGDLEIASDGIGALEIMKELSKAGGITSNLKVKFNEVNMVKGRITIRGEADSFESANILKERLIKGNYFKDILLTDLKTKAGGGAAFSLSITLKEQRPDLATNLHESTRIITNLKEKN